jgi:hypothetical protein
MLENQMTSPTGPFTDFTAGVLIYGLLVAILVAALLIGGFLIINLGMLSKRPEDRVGGRTPSDVAILRGNVWPESAFRQKTLPAEDDDEEEAAHAPGARLPPPQEPQEPAA